MATQGFVGFISQIYVKIGDDYVQVAEIRNITFTVTRDTIDASSHSTAGWKDFLLGLAQWSATADSIYVDGDAPQQAVRAALVDRTDLLFRFIPQGNDAPDDSDLFYGTGVITNFELQGPNNDVFQQSFNILGKGPLEEATPATAP